MKIKVDYSLDSDISAIDRDWKIWQEPTLAILAQKSGAFFTANSVERDNKSPGIPRPLD